MKQLMKFKWQKTLLFSTILCLTLTACSDSDSNTNNNILININASEEVPLTSSTATASGSIILNEESGALSGSVTATGMTVTAAHIHDGFAGTNGGVLLTLDVSGNTVSIPEQTILSDAMKNALLAGQYYFNLHSAAFPSGEIRGQIAPYNVEVNIHALSSSNEIPPFTTASTGIGYVTINNDNSAININVRTTTDSSPQAAHLHSGYAGENGAVIIPLQQDSSNPNNFNATATLENSVLQRIQDGGSYLNVHTATYPNGELRAQVLTKQIGVYTASLSGDQAVPAVTSNATGNGYLTVNRTTKLATAIVNTTELSNATLAHVHSGVRGSTGPVVFGLSVDETDANKWAVYATAVDDAAIAAFGTSSTYFNVHTDTNPGGEIRGQIDLKPASPLTQSRIRQESERFVTVFATNVGNDLEQFYAENGSLTLPGQDTVSGRSAVGAAWTGGFTQGGLRSVALSITSISETSIPGEYLEKGNYALSVIGANGPATINSTYSVLWTVPADGSLPLILNDTINP